MKRTILLADDSPTIQRLVTQTFADSEFTIVSVSNGDAAIRKLDEIHADVVLADVYMPGRNGYEVCAHVRSRAALTDIPVILLAGAFDAFDEQSATNAGATAHIRKPFEPRALVSLVMSVCGSGQGAAAPQETNAPAEIAAAVSAAPEPAASIATAIEPPSARLTTGPSPAAPQLSITVPPPHPPSPADREDLLGLEPLFKPAEQNREPMTLSDEEIDRIAERVIRRITKEAIENIAWDVVPDIASQVLRDELNRKP